MRRACYEFGGPQIYTYEELLRTVPRAVGARPRLIPMPSDEESAARLKAALEEAGVIFTAGGVKMRPRLLGGVVHERLNAKKTGGSP